MKWEKLAAVVFAAVLVLGMAASAGAVDGTIEINQATVQAAGGFAYNITASGSYRLTGNLTVPSGKSGITVNASNVTIDLNGFSITGGGSGSSFGIFAEPGMIGTTVENGTVTAFNTGVSLNGNSVVKSLHADSNATTGIIDIGNNDVIEGCTANNNTQVGVETGDNARVQGCTANFNSSGIVVRTGSVIEDCTANWNSSYGIRGLQADVVLHNAIGNNTVGMITFDSTTGYGENVFAFNLTDVSGSISMGTSMKNNVCDGTLC